MKQFRIFFLRFFLITIVSASIVANAEGFDVAKPKKKVFFIGTGGTIAGVAQDPSSPNYDPGQVTIRAILDAVPDIRELANIDGEQLLDTVKMQNLIAGGMPVEDAKKQSFVNVCSCDIAESHWQLLAKRVEKALEEDGNDAVIITHGTDTIEETSFALQFLVHSQKPIIMVGAARPSNNPNPDGPDNIRRAVKIAISDKAVGRGVMVAMGGRIYPAFDITEIRAMMPTEQIEHRFFAPHFGLLGEFDMFGHIRWNDRNKLLGSKILKLKFDTQVGMALPKVPILWQYAGNDSMDMISLYDRNGINAFIYAGYGLGSTPSAMRSMIKTKFENNADEVFINASRTKQGITLLEMTAMKGVINSATLSPYHAKIFLQLVLDAMASQQPEVMNIIQALPANATIRDKIKAIWREFLYNYTGTPAV